MSLTKVRECDRYNTTPVTENDRPVVTMMYGFLTGAYPELKWERCASQTMPSGRVVIWQPELEGVWLISKLEDGNVVLVHVDVTQKDSSRWTVTGSIDWTCYWHRFASFPELNNVRAKIDILLKRFGEEADDDWLSDCR